jgi:hypothetical protein
MADTRSRRSGNRSAPQAGWASGFLPAGLLFSVLIGGVSLGVAVACWRVPWPVPAGPALVTHVAAGLCLLWVLAAWALTDRPVDHPRLQDLLAVLRMAGLILGLLAFIVMLYQAMTETALRTLYALYPLPIRAQIWPAAWLDLTALAVALLLAWRRSADGRLITCLFWLAVFGALWAALCMPASREEVETSLQQHGSTHWSAVFMACAAAAVVVFTIVRGLTEHRHRLAAWPDELWKLTVPASAWPGFRYSAGVVGAGVLILGCAHVVWPWTPLAAIVTGGSLLALAHQRWEENLADAGIALITLGVASVATLGLPETSTNAGWYAEVFNRLILALAVMTAFWHWLADVWVQQLDNGQPWTTTGRMIRTARRVGFLVGATGALIAFHLAFWPLFSFVTDPDSSMWRWVWGLGGNVLLVLALAFCALSTGKSTLAWLTLIAVLAGATFVLTRIPGSELVQWWVRYWPLGTALMAAASLPLAAATIRSRRWLPFAEPFYLIGIVVGPVAALSGASLVEHLQLPHWMPAATFASLAGVYLLAAWVPGPRRFVTVAAMCAAVSIAMHWSRY